MGVRHLNRFMLAQCPRGIHMLGFGSLRNRTIVIDASIYLYKFKAHDALRERTSSMLSCFAAYQINPIFVFDGKPPPLKSAELVRRKHTDNRPRVSWQDVQDVKALLDAWNVRYIDAPSEADEVCARMVLARQAFACMSDDTDMFVHGCDRVLREVNFERRTAMMYNLEIILRYLDMTLADFKQLCIASGTDYYRPQGKNLYTFVKLFNEYRSTNQMGGFLEWLHHHDYLDDYPKALQAYAAFK
jgi:flap endonuclease-1